MRVLSFAAVGVTTAFTPAMVQAQADHPVPVMIPAGPGAMPGDYSDMRQDAQLKVALGPPAGRNTRPPHPPAPPIPGPSMAAAAAAAQAAVKSCALDGFTVTVAVTDAAGNLKAALAADGTRPNGIYTAMHKAVTVVGFRMSTLEFRQKVEKDSSLMTQVKPNMSLLPGGLPIFKAGQFIGAIATSGAAAYEEEKCARAGIDAI